jgi:hypothetical protein
MKLLFFNQQLQEMQEENEPPSAAPLPAASVHGLKVYCARRLSFQ